MSNETLLYAYVFKAEIVVLNDVTIFSFIILDLGTFNCYK